jgi:hypothetical protein
MKVFPFYPAQIVPLNTYLKTYDASILRIDMVFQNTMEVILSGMNENTGQAWQKKFDFDQCVYLDLSHNKA